MKNSELMRRLRDGNSKEASKPDRHGNWPLTLDEEMAVLRAIGKGSQGRGFTQIEGETAWEWAKDVRLGQYILDFVLIGAIAITFGKDGLMMFEKPIERSTKEAHGDPGRSKGDSVQASPPEEHKNLSGHDAVHYQELVNRAILPGGFDSFTHEELQQFANFASNNPRTKAKSAIAECVTAWANTVAGEAFDLADRNDPRVNWNNLNQVAGYISSALSKRSQTEIAKEIKGILTDMTAAETHK